MTSTKYLLERGIPAIDVPRIVYGYENTDAMKAAKGWYASGDTILVLAGNVGIGKTVAAGWIAAQDPPGDWHWSRAPRMVTATVLSQIPLWEREAIEPYERCMMLVIDDLGTEPMAKFAGTFDNLVSARYAAGLRTVATCNMDVDSFKKRYGERVADRIRQVGKFYVPAGTSMRRNPPPMPEIPTGQELDGEPVSPERMAEMAKEYLERVDELKEAKTT